MQELTMTRFKLSSIVMIAGLLAMAPAWAQTTAQKQDTQDGGSPPMVGPASKAYKQSTDGDGPPMIGPASKAFKQQTQSMSHSAPPAGDAKQD
jgi:hypothetical protein